VTGVQTCALPISGHQGVVPVQASTAGCDMLAVGTSCRGKATTLFYAANNSAWTTLSAPNSNYYSGAPSNLNLSGISAPGSTMTASLAFASTPGTPDDVIATAGDTSAAVSFTPPPDGGSPILDYTVTAAPGGQSAIGSDSPLTVTGLANGTAYTFTVTARNANGSGAASAPSNSVTPAVQVLAGGSSYSSIGAAYAVIADSGLLQLRDIVFNEIVDFNRPVTFSLKGGYDADFIGNSDFTTINGTLTVSDGSVTMENIVIR